MSNSNNLGKEIKRLRKEIADLGAQDSAFHFIVGDAAETADAKLERLRAEGKVKPGDTVQSVEVPWIVRELRGSSHIPEGSAKDPFAEPEMPAPQVIGTNWGEQRDREQRWKDHLRKIERDGTRYDPDKPKAGDGARPC